MAADMAQRQQRLGGPTALVHQDDARDCDSIEDGWADLVLTSPPYANNFDYADATRIEMTFFRDIDTWGDLQSRVRKHLLRSCTQHVSKDAEDILLLMDTPLLAPIQLELRQAVRDLLEQRATHGGHKDYHAMAVAYFHDMSRVFRSLRRATMKDALMCFVIGDSAPYGVYLPVERWMGELALAAGFSHYEFGKTRDRNLKWKNRKHRVPLKEGRLWIEG